MIACEHSGSQPPLTINRALLILALQYAIHERSLAELITLGHVGESDVLKDWRNMLAMLQGDEPVKIV